MFRGRVITAFAIVGALSGCKPVEEAINNAFYKGTLAGAEKCMELKASTLVSAENVKAACVAEFEDDVPTEVGRRLEGTGKPDLFFGQNVFTAWFENKNPDYVITEVELEILFLDKEKGVDKRFFATRRVWIEPGQKNFEFRSDEIKYAPDNWAQVGRSKEDWSWSLSSVKGLAM